MRKDIVTDLGNRSRHLPNGSIPKGKQLRSSYVETSKLFCSQLTIDKITRCSKSFIKSSGRRDAVNHRPHGMALGMKAAAWRQIV